MRVYSLRFVSLAILSFPAVAHSQALNAEQDTWLNGNNPSKILGDAKVIVVSDRGPKVGLIQFDTSSISNTESQSAVLDLFVDSVATGGNVGLHMVRGAWSEGSVSFSVAPAFDSTPLQTFPVSKATVGGVIGIDISAAVQEWASDPGSNFGLALTSTDAFVRFGSAEGGMPATVEVSPGEALSNLALVAKEGGDYTNPLDAIEDLDTWCDHTCTLLIGPGRFELTSSLVIPEDRAMTVHGFGRDVTILLFTGVHTAIQGSGIFSDFAVVNEGGDGSAARGMTVAESSIENVRVTVSRANTAFGIDAGTRSKLTSVEVRALEISGGAVGISGRALTADQIDISLTAGGATGYLAGADTVAGEVEPVGSLTNFNIRILAAEGDNRGLRLAGNGCALEAAHGTVNVIGGVANINTGVQIFDCSFTGRDLRIVVGSANNPTTGIDAFYFDFGSSLQLENSYIFAESPIEGVGLRIEAHSPGAPILVKHSELSGEDVGLLVILPQSPSAIAIDNSVVSGGTNSIVGQPGWKIGVGASKVIGPTLPQGSEITCAFVYDADYNELVDSCP